MSLQSESREVAGHSIRWHQWLPESELKGAIFFLHGQGDFAERYQDVASLFGQNGYAFLSCDLPGHGQTPGLRGHIPSVTLIEEIARIGFAEARSLVPAAGQKVGFGGHSVGGLLALHCLPQLTPTPDFSWISSPLLVADAGQAPWRTRVLRPLSHLLPRLTVSTGVTADMCRILLPGETATDPLLFHNRISLSWGVRLIILGEEVRSSSLQLPAETSLLLTQGERDLVCPPQFTRDFVASHQTPNLRFELFPEARHEPFADASKEEVFAKMTDWLSGLSSAS